jgi:aminoglycoside phosphotransferase (APT) family kinase protein
MPRNIQLLKQVRHAVKTVSESTDNPNHKMQLSISDMFLNELMLQDQPRFYLDFLHRGKLLLAEGAKLAARYGKSIAPSTALRDDLHEESRNEVINDEIDALNQALVAEVQVLDESRSAEEKDFLERITAWESGLYLHRRESVTSVAGTEVREITAKSLETYLQKKHPDWKGLKVTKFVRLEGGISKMTILFETEDAVNGVQSLVLRADQPVNLLFFDGSDVRQEFYMIALMHKLGMPVPKALWLEDDDSHLGSRFVVTTKSEGKNFYSGLASLGGTEKPSQEIVDSFMQVLYQMHGLKPDPADPLVQKSHLNEWMPHKTIRDAARYNAAVYVPKLISRAGIKMTPQLLRALRWLEANAPDTDELPVVVHVDYAFNNILFHNNRVSAVLDWETSRLGDPCDDILWSQHSLGVYTMPEFLKVYEQATSRHIDEYRMAYARVQKCVLNIIAGLTALAAIDADDHAPLHMGVMGLKYMPLFGADVGELITAAEKVKGR